MKYIAKCDRCYSKYPVTESNAYRFSDCVNIYGDREYWEKQPDASFTYEYDATKCPYCGKMVDRVGAVWYGHYKEFRAEDTWERSED